MHYKILSSVTDEEDGLLGTLLKQGGIEHRI